MFKKIIILVFLVLSLGFNLNSYASTDVEKKAVEEERKADCDKSWNCIDQPNFEIKVDNISPWMKINWKSTKENINHAFGTIIQKLMIALGSLSLLIMTVWAWYMVLNWWQDELLNKWKSIFMAWVYSMVVALASYYIIVIVRYILYA